MISFSIVLMMAAVLFPLLFRMLAVLNEGKKDVAAYRLLYEQIENAAGLDEWGGRRVVRGNIEYAFSFHDVSEEAKKACVHYEEKTLCIEK
jgi:hypothetical protein